MQENQYKDSIYFFLTIFKKWKFLLTLTLLGAIISTIVAFILPQWYASTCNLVPSTSSQESSGGASSMISSALKEFGVTKMTGSSSQEAYSYIVILTSRTVVDSIINKFRLDTVYKIPKNKFSKLREAFLDNVEVTYEKEGNYTITIWDTDKYRAADIANAYVDLANEHFIDIFRQDTKLSKEYFEGRIFAIDSTLTVIGDQLKKFTQKTLLFSPEEQAQSVAKSLADIKAEQVKYDIFYEFYKKNYGEQDPLAQTYKKLSNEVASKLNTIQTQPGFAGNFSLTNATGVAVDYLRLYTEFETYTKVRAFLIPMIEKIRSDEIKNIQNLIVVDKAIPADKKDKPKRAYIIAGSTFGTFVLGILLIFLFDYFNEIKTRIKSLKANESNKQ
jgi:uncharacterized protein involved in exopolysaccharide biosynthesis